MNTNQLIEKKKLNFLNMLKNPKGEKLFYFVLFITLFTILSDIITFFIFSKQEKGIFFCKEVFLRYLKYFTFQMNIAVLLILLSFFLKIKNKKIHSLLIIIIMVDALLTTFIYNLFLHPFWTPESSDFVQIIRNNNLEDRIWRALSISQHVLIPFSYFVLFFFFIPVNFNNFRKIFLTFIHPILFLSFYYLLLFSPNKGYRNCKKGGDKCFFPYPNIQCHKQHSYRGKEINKLFGEPLFDMRNIGGKTAVFFRILILTFFFSFLFFFVLYFKNKFNDKKSFLKGNIIIYD
ncbi:MAG: hypothetical protein ACQKHC_00155 [Candidatus Phytoplasma pruni]|uniref:hypothetical protein n=1 Tax=Milkweed yellows phytoplasma TaxID=208434 RepID=UPI00036FC9C3|nr:hypothetical protein [Milkweed yellows phytoplasma]